jgi:TIGR03009 family protein
MNWRGLPQFLLIALISLILSLESDCGLFAQSNLPGKQRLNRDRLVRPNLQVQQLSPKLEQILKDWSQASDKIQKLQGSHSRWVYNHTFEIEKQASGVFYFESPDKGRIDIVGQSKPFRAPRRKFNNGKPDSKNGKVYQFKSDLKETWIADGRNIKKIDEKIKTVEVFPIPPESQGKNIMDGPLPFLFGMPPEKAKRRFRFVLLGESETKVWLQIWPKLQQDRANWKQAKVILLKPSYLPDAVQLIDPAGTSETDYRFNALVVNKPRTLWNKLIGSRHWTNPKLTGYQVNINEPKTLRNEQNANPPNMQKRQLQPAVPSVVGLNYDEAKRAIFNAGYYVKFEHGTPTANRNQVWRVEAQSPRQSTPLAKRKTVTLLIMPPKRKEDRHAVPPLLRVWHIDAKKTLTDLGYQVSLLPGTRTEDKKLLYRVQSQTPLPNEPLPKGQKVTLRLFNKPNKPASSIAQKSNGRTRK